MSLTDTNSVAGGDDAKLVADRETTETIVALTGDGKKPTPPRGKAKAKLVASKSRGRESSPSSRATPTDGDAGAKSLSELRKREHIIRQGRKFWRDGTKALMEIRDLSLYKAEGYTDLGKYSREKLDMGKSTVNRLIAVAEVYNAVASTGAKILPTSERQMRPLLKLRSADQTQKVWGKTVAKVWTKVVQDAEITKEKITQKRVFHALEQLGLAPKPNEPVIEHDLEKRWQVLEAKITHEAEFWQGEQRHKLRVRIVELISGWETKPSTAAAIGDETGLQSPKTSRSITT